MSDQEKTLLIIGLMPDWEILDRGADGDDIILSIGGQWRIVLRHPFYLYNQKWMWAAWLVLNYTNAEFFNGEDWCDGFFTWYHEVDWYRYDPGAAQRVWLNKILKLAIEAGMVTK